jgi:hypothetical protein
MAAASPNALPSDPQLSGVMSMPIRADEVPVVNGRLKQIGKSFRSCKRGDRSAVFQCECGNKTIKYAHRVRSGNSKSCGCLVADNPGGPIKHGQSHRVNGGRRATKEYTAWTAMHRRCTSNEDSPAFEHYTGRGIKVCDRWKTFENFFQDMGVSIEGTSLDRIDNNGDYEKSNCRWTDSRTQNRNTRSNVYLTFLGETIVVLGWAEKIGIPENTLRSRLRMGWSTERALTTPVRKRN